MTETSKSHLHLGPGLGEMCDNRINYGNQAGNKQGRSRTKAGR